MPEFEAVKVEIESNIGRLTLNRPESLNALDEKMAAEIQSVLKSFSNDTSVRCVSITGAGRAFSAGQNLKEVSPGRSFSELLKMRYKPIIKLITGMEKPVVALINGIAAGAGMGLALACDFKIMKATAKFIPAFVKIGLVPDSGLSFFLPRLIGYSKAFELAALGDEIFADEALSLGIVNRVFSDEEFVEQSRKILEHFANGPTRTYSLIKRMLKYSSDDSLERSLEYEAHMQEIAGRTEDAREGINAFFEKRLPTFRGR